MSGDDGFFIARICLEGHVDDAFSVRHANQGNDHCPVCGGAIITKCPHCEYAIRGRASDISGIYGTFPLPKFCRHCARPFPWTESARQAAIELFCDEVSDKQAQLGFGQAVVAIQADTPAARVAVHRLPRFLEKLGDVTRSTVVEILAKIASDAFTQQVMGMRGP